jgi:hypothetical protein
MPTRPVFPLTRPTRRGAFSKAAFVLMPALLLAAPACRVSNVGQDVPLDRMVKIEIENPLDTLRPAVNIMIPLADLVAVAKDFTSSSLALYDVDAQDALVPCQVDDLDQDGAPDVLAFQLSFQPKQRKRLDLCYNPGRSVQWRFPSRAHAAVHPELEGPAWESDAIAFRLFQDGRNAIGVFAKPEPSIAIERYAKAKEGSGGVQPWGTDVLAVAETLGCGGFGFVQNGRIVRPLETARTKEQPAVRRFAQVVADGPVRAIVRLTIDNWVVDGAPRTVKAVMTIWAGRRWATCDLDVGAGWRPPVAVGVAGAKDIPMVQKKEYFYTFGAQSLPMSDTKKAEPLGLGVLFKQEHFAAFLEEAKAADAAEDPAFSRAVVLTPDAEGRLRWAYIAAWARGKLGIRDAAEFDTLCESAIRDLATPVRVTIRSR